MLNPYTNEKYARQQQEALVEWFEADRRRRTALSAQQRRPGRLRMAIGERLLQLGAALISCEDLAHRLIERRAAEGTQ